MTHLIDYSESIVDNIGDADDTFTEIKKKLLDDFDTAETVHKVLKGSKIDNGREPIKVYLRVKPLTAEEIEAGESQDCLEIENPRTVALHPPKTSFTFKHQSRSAITAETIQRFTFSQVFGPETNQRKFFEKASLDTVRDFINGQNCLVFSYGITNAGKTYTILGDPQNAGVLPRTIKILFNSFKNQNYEHCNLKPKMFCDVVKLSSIQQEREESTKKNLLLLNDVATYHQSISSSDLSIQDSIQEQHSQEDTIDVSSLLDATSVDVEDQGPIKFSLWVSFAEIYNEYIYDLLEPISMNKETRKRTALRIGDDRKGNPYIKGLTEIHVNNAEEACKLLKIGRKNQKIASTKLNQNSSRSHCIFSLKILRVVDTKEPHVARVSRLSFVDLAGSERYAKTQNTGVRLKEAGNINTSIMTLGKCVELLRYNQNHVNNQKNIPFRESKLTRLFQGFFCGKGKASMIVNVNQCASAFDETLHALKFSAIAKKVTTIAHGPQPTTEISSFLPKPSLRSSRSSVAWADGSVNTPAGNKAQLKLDHLNATVSNEETTEVIPPADSQVLQNYEKVIAELQAQLIEERKQKTYMEMKIREEVCQEMAEQLVEIEKNYNERIQEEQRATEELYEKRIDMLTKSVKKTRKRPRVERVDDEEDEYVSSVLLHAEQVKNREMKAKGDELSAALEEQNKITEELKEKMAVLEQEKDKIIENLKHELCKRDESIAMLEKDNKEKEEKMTSDLQIAEQRNAELRNAEERTNELGKEINSLKKDHTEVVKGLKKDISEREQQLLLLEKEIENLKKKGSERIEREIKEQKEKVVSELRKGIEHRDKKISSLEEIMAKNEKLLTEMNTHTEEMKKKNSEITTLREQVKKLESTESEKYQNLKNELSCRDEQLEKLERSLKDCKVELEEKNAQLMAVKKVQGGRQLTPTKSSQNNLVKQLEKRLAESTTALDKKNSQLISKNNTIVKLEKNIKEMEANLSVKEQELNELRSNKMEEVNGSSEGQEDSKDITINDLNTQLKKQQDNLLNKTKEKDEVEENLKFVEGELQILSSKEKETQEEMKKCIKERDEMKEKSQEWKMKMEEYEKVVEDLKKQMEIQAERIKQLECRVQELTQVVDNKEEALRDFKNLHNKQLTELNDANQELHGKFDKALCDLANVQATVVERNQKLDDMENLDSSRKDAYRCMEAEVVQLRSELKNVRNELRGKNEELNELKEKMGTKINEMTKVKENWDADEKRLKTGLQEQEEVLMQFEKDLASKEEEINDLKSQVEKLLQSSEKVKDLTKDNDNLEEQCERLKIKIFELETEVEKLQQDVKKETTKKDTATQALRDGLEIVKAKKLEYESEKKELQKAFETKIANLEEEVERLKSVSSESNERTDSSSKESGNSSSGDSDYVYKAVEVESFNHLPDKDRVEIDVTPITGRGRPKGSKKTTSSKTKSLKRKSSDLTLKEVQQICLVTKERKGTSSDDEFTPVSQTKLRKTRSSVSGRSKQFKSNMTASTFSLTTLDEDTENTNPKTKSGRKILNKLPLPESLLKSKTDINAEPKTKKRKKLFMKKTDISSPFTDSPPIVKSVALDKPTKAQELIMRRLRSRDVKVAR